MIVVKKKANNPALRWINANPGRVISLSFLAVILVGTALLVLPFATQSGQTAGLLKALFTATSATCVTGLIVADTATYWTGFGKFVILALIQIGGLGLVTITSFFYSLMRRKTSLRTLVVTQESTASFGFADVLGLVRRIIIMTLSVELIGACVFAWRFVPKFGWSQGLGKAFFQSISAFCNAGFDLFGNTAAGPYSSLTSFGQDPVVMVTTSLLVIVGGLGFVVWSDLLAFRIQKRLNFHTKVVLAMTGILLLAGTALYLGAEYSNIGNAYAMGSLPTWQRPLAAFYQSVMTRTAGFNSIDQASLSDSSKFMTLILMFVGAAPGSTAGGIKVTTLAVILATIYSDVRGQDEIVLVRHRLPRETFTRAFGIAGLGMALIMVSTLLLSFFERDLLAAGSLSFLDLCFESTSAFATVGLSSAGTSGLSHFSWAVLIPVIYLGRVGPAAFAISLALMKKTEHELVHPEGKLLVG